jgi:hypothetical protein
MSLSALVQITDQDAYTTVSTQSAELKGQVASTPDGRIFSYTHAGASNLAAGKITSPPNVTANYVTRTLSVAAAAGANQITVTLGTTATQDQFKGWNFVVTDGTGKGQGSYYITGNTAATSGNSNTTVINIRDALNVALDTTSVVGAYPSQFSAQIIADHTAAPAVPVSGAPIIAVTATYFYWTQTGGMASILQNGTISKNAGVIASSTTDGAVDTEGTSTVTRRVGYMPEAGVSTKYSPTVLTLDY